MDNLKCEFGSIGNIRFGGMKATLHDSEGDEIKIPICETCNLEKDLISGKETSVFFCPRCNQNYEAIFIYKPPMDHHNEIVNNVLRDNFVISVRASE